MSEQGIRIKGEIALSTKIDDMPVVDRAVQSMAGQQGLENVASMGDALNSSNDSLKENTAIMKEFGNMLPDLLKNFRQMNDLVSRTNQNLPTIGKTLTSEEQKQQRISDAEKKGFLDSLNTGNNMLSNWANGNSSGVTQSFLSGVKNATDAGRDIAKTEGNGNMLDMLTKVGIGAMVAGAIVKGLDTLASKYVEAMPSIFATGKAFGTTDNDKSLAAWHKMNTYNEGTGLNVEEFQSLATAMRKQGLGNGLSEDVQMHMVGNVAKNIGRWAYATDGDVNQFASMAGMMGRYGRSKDIAGDFNYLMAAGKASGLENTQLPEFLSGIQKVMEDGIAKGFSRSATEVADTLLMFSKLSGNSAFWQGEQGAKRLSQINSGIAGATALGKTEDLLVYAAMEKAYTPARMETLLGDSKKGGSYIEGADYINTMQMIERGIDPENFDDIMGFVNSSYGNKAQRIEALRKISGLNYGGAAAMYALGEKGLRGADLKTELKNIQDAPENKNNETRNQENLNRIKDMVVDIGKGIAEVKIAGMDNVSAVVKNIYDFLAGEESPEPDKDQIASRQESLVLRSGGKVSAEDVKDLGFFDLTPIEYSSIFDSRTRSIPGGGAVPDWHVKRWDGRFGFDSDNFDDLTNSATDLLAAQGKSQAVKDMFGGEAEARDIVQRLMNGRGKYEDLRYRYQEAVKDANADEWWDANEKTNLTNILMDILKEMKDLTVTERM